MKGIITYLVGGSPEVRERTPPKPHSQGPTQMLDIPASGPLGTSVEMQILSSTV